MRSGVTTVPVHAAAAALSPIAADGASEVGSAASIGSRDTGRGCGWVGHCGGHTKHWFARRSGRRRSADDRGGVFSAGLGRSRVLASILATVGDQAVAVGAAAVAGGGLASAPYMDSRYVPVRGAATSVRTTGVT
jgi:hypothetical protein